MTPEYVKAAIKRAHPRVEELPIFVANDPGSVPLRERLEAAFPSRVVHYEGPEGVFVDMLLLLRSRFFIGNVVSSFSRNVGSVRKLAIGESAYPYQSILVDHFVRPHITTSDKNHFQREQREKRKASEDKDLASTEDEDDDNTADD
eukprot:CAMPEP_0174265114 /NCGR_PEP_ID=MMETSP0439-20130205/25324_1 /TAXON_ID=0 /ORGANISM="Stereomyxa ramosa, Strain Chinc5" /LENGTH=145 /DNA_ID=CAMNT_0015351405 /DNA_START=241 /DNA_END=678 /DNA_ORIENTATION=-